MRLTLKKKNTILAYLYIIFLLSASIKVVLIYFNIIIIDITLLLSIILSVDLLFNFSYSLLIKIKKDILGLTALSLFLLFYLLCIFSLLYTPSEGYSYKKTILMILNLLAFIYPMFNNEVSLNKIKKVIILVIIPLSLWFAYLFNMRWSVSDQIIDFERFELIRANYLTFSLWLGILVLILADKENFFNNKLKIFLILLLILVLGARGPLLFVLLILLFNKNFYLSFFQRSVKVNKLIFSLISAFSLIVFIFLFHELIVRYFSVGINRFALLFESDGGISSRTGLLEFSFNKIFHAPIFEFFFGHGIGSFNIYYEGIDAKYYPHNILVEAWFEMGLTGMLVMLSFIILPFLKKNPLIPISIIIFLLLNAMKTSSFVDIRIFYGFYGVYIFSFNEKYKFINSDKSK